MVIKKKVFPEDWVFYLTNAIDYVTNTIVVWVASGSLMWLESSLCNQTKAKIKVIQSTYPPLEVILLSTNQAFLHPSSHYKVFLTSSIGVKLTARDKVPLHLVYLRSL